METDESSASSLVFSCTGYIDEDPARALAGLLDLDPSETFERSLPPLWHWLYLLDRPAQHTLGHDGHSLAGTIPVPPGPGLRRMFAGGRVTTLHPLTHGSHATRRSWTVSTTSKTGRSGKLTFVTIRHDIEQDGRTIIRDEQDLVYRDVSAAAAPDLASSSGGPPADATEIAVDATLLFRFSALTYNAHRIHYDRDYARTVEGYPGLVVHGPFQALVMSEAARGRLQVPGPSQFEYRLISPLFDGQGMFVGVERDGDAITTTVCDRTGRRTAQGRLSW
jgi:3-methylfumaryl-CoA hydratase